ncbi:MAG: hypothetical protein U9R17_00040, partial [Thermodesulfobacteriota bacterium]|nr:hypothetical protein [Thermodesulfobacteriota bacterium]
SEVVTITGTVAETLSSHTISPMAPDCKFIYTYSNPKLVRYEGDVSVETYPDMNFSWVIPSEESEWYYKTGIYVEYDLEVQRYSQEDENAPFTHDKTTTFKSKVFHLVIEANKDVPEWDTP